MLAPASRGALKPFGTVPWKPTAVPSPLISHFFRIFTLHPVAFHTPLAMFTSMLLCTILHNLFSRATPLPSFVNNVVPRRTDPLGIPAVFWFFLAKYKTRIDPPIDKDAEDQGNADRLVVSKDDNPLRDAVLADGGTGDRVLDGLWRIPSAWFERDGEPTWKMLRKSCLQISSLVCNAECSCGNVCCSCCCF